MKFLDQQKIRTLRANQNSYLFYPSLFKYSKKFSNKINIIGQHTNRNINFAVCQIRIIIINKFLKQSLRQSWGEAERGGFMLTLSFVTCFHFNPSIHILCDIYLNRGKYVNTPNIGRHSWRCFSFENVVGKGH